MAFGTKPRDDTFDGLRYKRVSEFPPYPRQKKLLLWPPFDKPSDQVKQRDVFKEAFDDIFTQGGWCCFVDEARYFIDTLKLGQYLKLFWGQGRSLGISLVTGTQRPAHMPLEFYDQATHLFIFKDNDRYNVSRLAGLAGAQKVDEIKAAIPTLGGHDFIYVNTRSNEVFISKCPEGR